MFSSFEAARRKLAGGSWEEEAGRRRLGGGSWEEAGERRLGGGRWSREESRGGPWPEVAMGDKNSEKCVTVSKNRPLVTYKVKKKAQRV